MSTDNKADSARMHYDIRVVRLAKTTSRTKVNTVLGQMDRIRGNGKNDPKASNLNLCLGHFDVMIIDRVTAGSGVPGDDRDHRNINTPLYKVIADYKTNRDLAGILGLASGSEGRISENGSYCPIYMLLQHAQGDPNNWQNSLDAFWALRSNYTVVMRLHQALKPDEPFTLFRKQLIARLTDKEELKGSHISGAMADAVLSIQVDSKDAGICCVFYDSMELGDVVAVLKGSSLHDILMVQRWLYEAPCVSSAYSYCGIRYDLLNGSDISPEDQKCLSASRIDYVETRFSVKNTDLAWRFLSELNQDPGYFVTGSVDALVHRKDKSEYEMLNELRWIINYLGNTPGDQKVDIYDLFHDVVTRVGLRNAAPIRNGAASDGAKAFPPIRLEKELLNWLSEEYAKTNHPDGEMYAYSLEKLVSSLNAMSENSVTDALSQLMYNGILALIEQLEQYRKGTKAVSAGGPPPEWNRVGDHALGTLQDFLDHWTSATNEILHLESQLFQHPDLVPVRYYVPAMILQFQLLIVEKAMEAVRSLEQNKKRYTYVPIMLPTSQQHTNTEAIFDPKEEPDYDKQSPLCIYVPIHLLYHPYRISLILCHEIAHYCGNEIRYRKTRNDALYKCMSFYAATRMVQYLGLLKKGSPGRAEREQAIAPRIKACVQRMERHFACIMTETDKTEYLDDVIRAFSKEVPALIRDHQVINDIVSEVLRGFIDKYEQLRICDLIQMEAHSLLQKVSQHCLNHLKCCLEPLFRECFADIVMILLTDCSFRHYYLGIIHDECLNLSNQRYENEVKKQAVLEEWSERHGDRITLVALCMNQLHQEKELTPWYKAADKAELNSEYIDLVEDKVKHWGDVRELDLPKWYHMHTDISDYSYALTGSEAREILKYLVKCAKEIYGRIHSTGFLHSDIAELRRLINMLTNDNMDWDTLQEKLHNSRVDRLKEILSKSGADQDTTV